MNNDLAKLLQLATRRRAEATLIELFAIFELAGAEDTLSRVLSVNEQLSKLGLKLIPGIQQGDLETVRRIELLEQLPFSEPEVVEDLKRPEAEGLELKSSLVFDHARAKADKTASITQLKSESVLYTSLRTIGAFLTCSGGVLYVGVDDSRVVLGIEYDFPCITDSKPKQNVDQWELYLRNHIQERFKDGRNVNDYVSCAVLPVTGKLVARIEVAPRAKLSFLKGNGGFCLYRRQGNRTVEVTIDLVEEFIEFRKGLRS